MYWVNVGAKLEQTVWQKKSSSFTRHLLVLGNFGLLGWVFLAFCSVLFYNSVYGWLYLILLGLLSFTLLCGRLGCSSCYKCKVCTSGFGRLAGVFFGKGFVKRESVGNRIWCWWCLPIFVVAVPLGLLSVSLWLFSFVKVLVLVCLLAMAIYSLTTWYNRSTVNLKKTLIWEKF